MFWGTCQCEFCYGGCEYDAMEDSDICWDCTEGAHA